MIATNIFEQLENHSSPDDLAAGLNLLSEYFRSEKRYQELFQVLKMQARNRIGLPVLTEHPWEQEQANELDDQQQRQLEDQLLEACREIGTLLIKDGRVAEGWVYLEPLGDDEFAKQLIENVPVDEENIDTLIDVSLGRGAALGFGFKLLIGQRGTCNAITTFDSFAAQLPYADQQELASILLEHIYAELRQNILNHLQESDAAKANESTTVSIRSLTREHPEIFSNGGHHLDATHIASIIRISRILEDPVSLNEALEICEYGKRLSKDLQFPDSPPFENTYVDHEILFRALMGSDIETALNHFGDKSKTELENETEKQVPGFPATENYIMLLHRVGKGKQAIEFAIKELTKASGETNPRLMELASSNEDLKLLAAHYKDHKDVLRFAMCLWSQTTAASND